jgi:hypothetical protein
MNAERKVHRRAERSVQRSSVPTRLGTRLREQSSLLVLRGLLAHEGGRDREAAGYFREALDLWQSDAAVSSGSGLDFHGRVLAQHRLRLVEKTKEKAPAGKR